MNIRTYRTCARRQRGVVGVMAPVLMLVILSIGAIAIDLGYLYVIRNELQNAADAAALAGAAGLYPASPKPNWSNGVSQGTSAIKLNASSGATLKDGSVQAGYWNLTGSPAGLQAQTITPGANDVPAVQVTISRSSGKNGGPVGTWLASIFNGAAASVQTTAVAVIAAPGTANAGALFPVALNKCLFDLYWNSSTGQPVNDPSTGQPFVIDINSSYPPGSATCASGEWTGFGGATDASTEKSLVTSGNPTPVSIGSNINISNGVKASVYDAISYPTAVTMPVVTTVSPGATTPVYAFAGFVITNVVKHGNKSYIEGHFTANQRVVNSGGGSGPYYGAYVPPRLAN